MARRYLAGLGAALALAFLPPAPAAEAQSHRNWSRERPPVVVPAPPPSRGQRVPDYYFERRGPVATPRGPVGPGDVTTSLRARGFRDIGPVQQRGNTVIVPRATGPSGEAVQLVIGPNGEIVGVRVLPPGGR